MELIKNSAAANQNSPQWIKKKLNMRNFAIQYGIRLSILLLLTTFISVVTACGSSTENASQGGSSNAEPNKNVAAEKKTETNKISANAETKANETVVIFDGRKSEDKSDKEASSSEKDFVWKEFKKSESLIKEKLGDQYCNDPVTEQVEIYGVAEGAFTKPNSTQKAYLYYSCELGRGFGLGGIVIAEDNKLVAHYAGQVSWSEVIHSLSDINKNGLNEILLSGGGSGQGYTTTTINILEFKQNNLDNWGQTETYSDNLGAVEKDSDGLATAFKILVQPSTTPTFSRDVFEKKGNAKDWKSTKTDEKFNLDKIDVDWKKIQ